MDIDNQPVLDQISKALAALNLATRRTLREAWLRRFGSAAPPSISQPFLRRFLAFEEQLEEAGGWPDGLDRRIESLISGSGRVRTPEPLAGGRLLREWNGTTHVVEITEGGYRWNGRTWRSLSAIAREITGAHWSGPRFFGLTKNDP